MASSGSALVTLSLKASMGVAAKRTASAFSTAKLRSGTAASWRRHTLLPQPCEESANVAPHLATPRKTPPVSPDQAHELVTFVDWRQIVFGGGESARVPEAVYQKRLYIMLHIGEHRIFLGDVVPGFQRQQGLGRP